MKNQMNSKWNFDIKFECYLIAMWLGVLSVEPLHASSTLFWTVNLVCFILLILRQIMYLKLQFFALILGCAGVISFFLSIEYLSIDVKSIGTNVGIGTIPMYYVLFSNMEQSKPLSEAIIDKNLKVLSRLGTITFLQAWILDFSDIYQATFGNLDAYEAELSGIFYTKNIYGAFIALSMCADLYLYKKSKNYQYIWIIQCMLKVLAIVLSYSRAAMLQASVAIVLFYLLQKRYTLMEIWVAVTAGITAFLITYLNPDVIVFIQEKILRIDTGDAGRGQARQEAIERIPDTIMTKLFGVGYSGVVAFDIDIDNSFYYLYFTGGWVKVILYLILIGWFLYKCMLLRNKNAILGNICLAVGISYLAFGWFESIPLFELGLLNYVFMWFMYFIPCGNDEVNLKKKSKERTVRKYK